jgi:DNA-binding SARP family transcriptional activator/tetratricopeptide (TPR) repeat protein
MGTRSKLRIQLLGELQLADGNGTALTLPASRKTRALLGYLIASGQAHRRERLCDFFWDGPDDPRAELRWSLSKIRPLLKDGGAELVADRVRVGIELRSATVDLLSVRSLLSKGVPVASTGALKQAAALFRGEFLDGLDLPVCYRYQEWCMAEREAISQLRVDVLTTLVERLHDQPEDALPYARAVTVSDPLGEAGHATVVRLLARMGKTKEAHGHYEHARRILETELGARPSEELKQAYQALKAVTHARIPFDQATRPADILTESAVPPSVTHFVGRDAERATIERILAFTIKKQTLDVVLVIGEPGIGKSHFLNYVAERITSAGACAWSARAFEPEASRPYGIWFDILRAIARTRSREEVPTDLAMLLPEVGSMADSGDRTRFFDAVVELLRQVTAERAIAITLDDIQWIDEASCSLLHYVARHVDADSGLLIVCAARAGEIEDNSAATSLVRSLSREKRLRKIELSPLGSEETAELVRLIDPALDGARIFAGSEGNPLFTLELARAHRRGDAEPGPTIDSVITGQFERLTDQAREILFWAAANGRAFTPDHLALATRVESAELLMALGELERRGLVRPASNDDYDFTHDLVRQTAYRSISQPRRKLIHRHIARALHSAGNRDTTLGADLAYHAALAEDYEVAAQACALAGERALRLFANVEAASFADRGLRYNERLADTPAKLENRIALLKVRILAAAGPGMRPLPPLIGALTELARAAEKADLHAAAATAHYLLSVLHQEAGDTHEAEGSTLRAAAAGRSADETTRANQLANTARCLLELETEIGRSRELIREGTAIVDPLGLELCELHWAQGLLHRWEGDAEKAVESLARALELARKNEDRWREYKCLTWLAMLEQELGRYDEMQARCAELGEVATRLNEDETPFVSLALLATEEDPTADKLEDALRRLRAVDDKSYLAYALNSAAWLHLQAGRVDQARLYAAEALTAASAIRRENEVVIARAMLAQAGEGKSAPDLDSVAAVSPNSDCLSARARSTLLRFRDRLSDSNGDFHGDRPS